MRHVRVIIAAPCARAPSSTALCTALTRRSSRTSSLWTRTVVAREAHASNLSPARGPARVDAAASRHRRRLAGRLGRGRGVRLARPRRAHLLELDRRAAHGVACSTRRWLGIAVGLVRATGDRMRFHRAQTVSRRHKHTTAGLSCARAPSLSLRPSAAWHILVLQGSDLGTLRNRQTIQNQCHQVDNNPTKFLTLGKGLELDARPVLLCPVVRGTLAPLLAGPSFRVVILPGLSGYSYDHHIFY